MKLLKYILWGVAALVVTTVLAVFLLLMYFKKGTLPDYNAPVFLPGIEQEVTVYRDSLGIPHIMAENETDLYRAVGFVMAQDRMWQMDLLRRVTLGRLSEIFGAGLIETDHLMRALRISRKSEEILKQADPEILSALTAFSEGINHFIQKYPLPIEFKILGYHPDTWEPLHSVNLIGYMAWDLTMPWDNEVLLHQIGQLAGENYLKDLIPDILDQKTTVLPEYISGLPDGTLLSASHKLKELGAEVFYGSNNWAVSGAKSTTGKPLLANDMHLGLNIPGIWYQIHQIIDGKLNVTGVALPGQPWVISGHNDSIAWGMTNVMVDDMDFYVETLSDDTTRYLLDGEWRDLQILNETIQVKDSGPVTKTIRFTHRGPLVNNFKKLSHPALSMRWIGNEWSNEIATVYKLNHASNWNDFRDAVKTFIAVSQNVVYADYQGNIGLQTCAGIPIRPGDIYGFYPGNTTESDWQGLVPFEELPYEFNPERGYVSSANNKTVPDDYPYPVSHWFALPNRIDRIRELLEEKEKFSVEDFQQIQTDVTSKLAENLLDRFLPVLEKVGNWTDLEKNTIEALKKWDYNMALTSPEASVFEVFYRKIIENIIRDDVDSLLFTRLMGNKIMTENLLLNILGNPSSAWADVATTPQIETIDDILAIAFRESILELSSTPGGDFKNWQWGNLNRLTLKHPMGDVEMLNKIFKLNRGPYAVPGSSHTVCPYTYSFNNLYNADNGASQRHVYDLSDWDNSKTVIPTGTSGNPVSPYYCDQTGMYVSGRYHNDYFSPESVMRIKKYQTVITGTN